ncbi:MAG: GMC family oxidoreductase [Methylocystis sp.]|uniref:GMC family oxidoreductase n=1 Tax=Methylocystis sp. TaxID=1911079 RepID=UPI003DA2F1AB
MTGSEAVLARSYDFVICGSGSGGSVVARRLAENADVSVLLLEAGGDDDRPEVLEPGKWTLNIGSERDWNFRADPSSGVNGRALPIGMGKVLGGGSSINAMTWARGHQSDWDFYASEVGDPAWSYASVLDIYRRVEDWHGVPDAKYRGTGGPMFVEPPQNPSPLVPSTLEGARSVGIPTFESPNGRMMEGAGGASIIEMIIRNGKRQSVFRSYVAPYIGRPNLTVLKHALVTRLTFAGRRANGVEIVHHGDIHRISAGCEVVLSLGAVNTPKVLMLSGIGDQAELKKFGIPVLQHLPGVGQNFQDHVGFSCVWEYREALEPRNSMTEATFYWKSNAELAVPDMFACQLEVPFASAENTAKFKLPDAGWTMHGAVAQPKSRGRIRLTGSEPRDPVQIEANFLSHPDDMKVAVACVELCREIGNSAPLRPFVKREVMPGNLKGRELENFIRDDTITYFHETCSAKMGRDAMSVVDGSLQVYGVESLSIADGSILPRVTTGNTMAPCVVIGERAAEILKAKYKL